MLTGGMFFGVVHDIRSLYASVKGGCKSMGSIIEAHAGRTGRQPFLLFC